MENAQRFWLTILNLFALALMLTITVWLMTRTPSVENTVLVALFASAVGGLMQQHAASQAWWFGTNKGTADTTAVIRDIATGAPSPTTTTTTTPESTTTTTTPTPNAATNDDTT